MIYGFKVSFIVLVLALAGCNNAPLPDVENHTRKHVPETEAQMTPDIEALPPPLNCPIMLAASSGISRHNGKHQLNFFLVENSSFQSELGDVCEGDLKKLWPDLKRFDGVLKTHSQSAQHIVGISNNLRFFPETERALKVFIDQAATEVFLHDKLDKIDRSTLEGGMKVDHEILGLMRVKEWDYFKLEHAPVIEAVLSKYDLKMGRYGTEKLTYCYRPYDICRGYVPYRHEKNEFKLERVGAPFDWYSFQQPN